MRCLISLEISTTRELSQLLSPETPDTGTRGHEFKLYKHISQTRIRQNSFTERIVSPWNSLPSHVVQAPSVKAFERRPDKYWVDQGVKYDYEAPLRLGLVAGLTELVYQ